MKREVRSWRLHKCWQRNFKIDQNRGGESEPDIDSSKVIMVHGVVVKVNHTMGDNIKKVTLTTSFYDMIHPPENIQVLRILFRIFDQVGRRVDGNWQQLPIKEEVSLLHRLYTLDTTWYNILLPYCQVVQLTASYSVIRLIFWETLIACDLKGLPWAAEKVRGEILLHTVLYARLQLHDIYIYWNLHLTHNHVTQLEYSFQLLWPWAFAAASFSRLGQFRLERRPW